MKNLLLVLFIAMWGGAANAQINNPVQFTYTAKKIGDKTYELRITANIGDKWHMYSQDAGEGPEPTTISFTPNPLLSMEGKIKEVGKLEKSFDKNFNSVLKFYSNKVEFVQKVIVKSPVATVIKGSVNYMVCNDRQCLPPRDVPFTIKLGGK